MSVGSRLQCRENTSDHDFKATGPADRDGLRDPLRGLEDTGGSQARGSAGSRLPLGSPRASAPGSAACSCPRWHHRSRPAVMMQSPWRHTQDIPVDYPLIGYLFYLSFSRCWLRFITYLWLIAFPYTTEAIMWPSSHVVRKHAQPFELLTLLLPSNVLTSFTPAAIKTSRKWLEFILFPKFKCEVLYVCLLMT